jgi:hypothetical protein
MGEDIDLDDHLARDRKIEQCETTFCRQGLAEKERSLDEHYT